MKTKSAQMPPLPDDKNAAKAVVRKMLMDEAIVLLKASGLKHTSTQFDVPISFDDADTQNGNLTMQFAPSRVGPGIPASGPCWHFRSCWN